MSIRMPFHSILMDARTPETKKVVKQIKPLIVTSNRNQ